MHDLYPLVPGRLNLAATEQAAGDAPAALGRAVKIAGDKIWAAGAAAGQRSRSDRGRLAGWPRPRPAEEPVSG